MECSLEPSDTRFPPILLPHGVLSTIGRSKITKIKDHRVSKSHLDILPNCEKRSVCLIQKGPNFASLNGTCLQLSTQHIAKEGDVISMLFSSCGGSFATASPLEYTIRFRQSSSGYKRPACGMSTSPKSGTSGATNPSAAKSPKGATPPAPQSGSGQVQANGSPTVTRKDVKIPDMFLPKRAGPSAGPTGAGIMSSSDFLSETSSPHYSLWEDVGGNELYVYCPDPALKKAKSEVIAFDMDGTLITTISGRVFPKDDKDWKLLYHTTLSRLRSYAEENPGKKLLIVTNQLKLGKRPEQVDSLKRKIELVVGKIGLSILVFVAPLRNQYRKPAPGVWTHYINVYNEGVAPNVQCSLFVGDAAGRTKDHSCADRLFALNIGLEFVTPEQFFLGRPAQSFTPPRFDPRNVLSSPVNNDHITFEGGQDMIIMVGFPASGKTNFVHSVLDPKSYYRVSRDNLGSMDKCVSQAMEHLRAGRKVVIDNTNGERSHRKRFVDVAKKVGVTRVRCFVMAVAMEHAQHNNLFRRLVTTENHPDAVFLPDVAFANYKSKYEKPDLSEGFTDIQNVNFDPDWTPRRDIDASTMQGRHALYGKFLLDK